MLRVYSTTTCAFCKMVEEYLQRKAVPYQKVMVDDDFETRQMLFEKTGMMTVPITSDGERFVVGWNVAELNSLISINT
jgi:glutaredoxin 3